MKIAKEFRWEMGHRLPYHELGCQNIHGHSYRLVVELAGDLNSQGMLMDFGDIKHVVGPLIDTLDHAFLCSDNDPLMRDFLEKANLKTVYVPFYTTAENVCNFLMQSIITKLKDLQNSHAGETQNIERIKVRVYETDTNYAELERSFRENIPSEGDLDREPS